MEEHRRSRSWMLVLCYLSFLGFFPLLLERNDRQVRWHAKNGLLLFGGVVCFGALATLLGILVPPLSCLYPIVMLCVGTLYTVVVILAIVKALGGERLMVPGISKYADRF
ncbi:MAG: hypothetical protein ACRD1P_10230 [Thermoanaerobaculia bacterium]